MSAMEALISEVQRRNILWNKKNPRYKDRLLVDKEWDAVAHSTGISKEEAKRKWRNLRDQFAKELKKVRVPRSGDPSDEDGHYTGKWQYFASLQFLEGIVAPRSTEGNVFHIEASQESQTSLLDTNDIETEQPSDANPANVDFSSQVSVTADDSQAIRIVDVSQGMTSSDVTQENATAAFSQVGAKNGVSQFNTNSGGLRVNQDQGQLVSESRNMPSQGTATPRLKRKAQREKDGGIEQQLLNIEAKKLALLETPEDENSLFLRSLLPYFQKMGPVQQLRVRNKFQDILIQEMSSPSASPHSDNIHFRQHPSTAALSVAPSAYSNVSSPPSSTDSAYYATHFPNMYPL